IEKIEFGYDDEMYILGDVIDRGPQSLECVKWIMEQDNILTLIGNHELLFLDNYLHDTTGLYNTITEARETLSEDEMKRIVNWIMDITECKIVKLNCNVFYLNHTQVASQEYFETELTDRMFPSYDRYLKYDDMKIKDYICIYGHIPTMQMRAWHKQELSNKIWKNKDGSVIDIDCGAGFPDKGGCLGCLRLNDLKEFYVEI
ncbi:metallophosphoesterase, partial [Anaerotignum sp.]